MKIRYLFSGKASVKHLTTTEATGCPRLFEKIVKNKSCLIENLQVLVRNYLNDLTFLGSHTSPQPNKLYPENKHRTQMC